MLRVFQLIIRPQTGSTDRTIQSELEHAQSKQDDFLGEILSAGALWELGSGSPLKSHGWNGFKLPWIEKLAHCISSKTVTDGW